MINLPGQKITAMTAATALTGAEQIPILQGGNTRRTTLSAVLAMAATEADDGVLRFVGTHDGTATGTDQTVAFAAFIAEMVATEQPGEFIGGVRLTATAVYPAGHALAGQAVLPIVIDLAPTDKQFKLSGFGAGHSYLYFSDQIGASGDFGLKFTTRLGLWTGQLLSGYTGTAPNRIAPPPPHNLGMIHLRDFGLFGRGTNELGASVARQGGICFEGVHDNIFMHAIRAHNFNGTAYHFGKQDVVTTKGGVRECHISELYCIRCGSDTEYAIVFDGQGDGFGSNFLYIYGIECSLFRARGGILWRNATVDNSTHTVFIFGFKCHGTGPAGSIPVPESGEAYVIEGYCDTFEMRGGQITQCANAVGNYAVAIRSNSTGVASRVLIDGAIQIGQNGVEIQGSTVDGGRDIELIMRDQASFTGNVVTIGSNINGPVTIRTTAGARYADRPRFTSNGKSSTHVRLPDSELPPLPVRWTQWERWVLKEDVDKTNNTTMSNTADFDMPVSVGINRFLVRLYYTTTATADFKYRLISDGVAVVTAHSFDERVMNSGASAFTTTAISGGAMPGDKTILSSANGHGVIELVGTMTVTTAGAMRLRVAQDALDATANATTLLAGSRFERQVLA